LAAADRDYLKAIAAKDPTQREALLRAAADGYQNAIGAYQLVVMKYYVDEPVVQAVYPKGVTRDTIEKMSRQVQDETMARVRKEVDSHGADMHTDDYNEYLVYLNRATARLGLLLRR